MPKLILATGGGRHCDDTHDRRGQGRRHDHHQEGR
jgi:hypothetical protein